MSFRGINIDVSALLPQVVAIALSAAGTILEVYRHENVEIACKIDETPVTQADIAAHHLIVESLSRLTPQLPVLSEEGEIPAFSERQTWSHYWLVDPLDGTKEFIAQTDEFSVNIALVVDHEPVMGVIVSPVTEHCYYAAKGQGAYHQVASGSAQPLATREWPAIGPLSVAISRRHRAERLADLMAPLGDYAVLKMGSSLKFCAIAQQKADLYPRLGRTCEWDTAAGQCVLTEAGGAILDLQGVALRYNTKEDIYNPGFMATGDVNSLLKNLHLIKGIL